MSLPELHKPLDMEQVDRFSRLQKAESRDVGLSFLSLVLFLAGCLSFLYGFREVEMPVADTQKSLSDFQLFSASKISEETAKIAPVHPPMPGEWGVILMEFDSFLKESKHLSDHKVNYLKGALILDFSVGQLFRPGSTQYFSYAKNELVRLMTLVSQVPDVGAIEIVGFNDSTPVEKSNTKFRTNWELSGARAAKLLRQLIDAGVSPELLSFIGHGSTKLHYAEKDSNGLFIYENLLKNRRMKVRIRPKN